MPAPTTLGPFDSAPVSMRWGVPETVTCYAFNERGTPCALVGPREDVLTAGKLAGLFFRGAENPGSLSACVNPHTPALLKAVKAVVKTVSTQRWDHDARADTLFAFPTESPREFDPRVSVYSIEAGSPRGPAEANKLARTPLLDALGIAFRVRNMTDRFGINASALLDACAHLTKGKRKGAIWIDVNATAVLLYTQEHAALIMVARLRR